MVRYIDNFRVVQRTSDGYFDGSELLRQWNGVEGNPRRRMSEFIDSTKVKEFLKALAEDESHRAKIDIGENQLLIKIKGRNTKEGKTPDKVWMNPLLFIKFAMWINPTFEVKVLRFVYDEMIRYRNDAGDAYKELSSAVMKIVPKDFMPKAMQKVGEALNWVIFNSHEKSSLAPPGQSLAFSLGDEKGFEWIGAYDITADELLTGTDTAKTESKTAQAQMLILELLADGKRMPSAELEKAVNERGISSRTMRTAKSRIGDRLVTEKEGTAWVCYLRN